MWTKEFREAGIRISGQKAVLVVGREIAGEGARVVEKQQKL